ncbi:SUKH-4 family immunity protein [Streptomyces halobius]|uniref:SUKH-4 family immunity protein n=1 Tax=Streptomyces halobius TaxID=2879846 RepID=A0ABY4MCS8_9ACTN|nr:SUKH-4 family immunity protein [Streptomyces halobius]UQA95490.1 SUKH-4 family immunity protein [Streptomyces halobius]
MLDNVRRHMTDAVFVDCLHLSAEEVVRQVLLGLGVSPEDASERRSSLWDAQGLISRDAVVLLANAQWAGRTITSTEPRRVLRMVAERFGSDDRRCLRAVVEGDIERTRVPHRRHLPEVLTGDGARTNGPGRDHEVERNRETGAIWQQRAAQLLATAETPRVSFPVWAALCNALEYQPDENEGELRELIAQYPDHLSVEVDEEGIENVGFIDPAVRLMAREESAISATDQRRVFRYLSLHTTPASPLARYAAQALPLHAALGGALDELLSDGEKLAGVERYGLLQGLAAGWPMGVPQGTLAADIHYLETQRVDPLSHGEWVSWLHWAAVNRGLHDVADGLARTGVEMPWRTLWSHHRPYGVFGTIEGEVGRVDQVRIQRRGEVPVAVMRRVVQYDDMGGPLNEQYVERAFTLDDGIEVGTETVVRVPHTQDTTSPPTEFQEDAARPAPRTPDINRRTKPAGRGRWVVGGQGGLYAVDVLHTADSETGRWGTGPYLGPVTSAATWQCPDEALAENAPSQSWLEKVFGTGSCRTIGDAALPDGLRNTAAREFLTTVGMPYLTGQIPFLSTLPLDEQGLLEFVWPDDATEPEADGPFYRLGSWMGGAVVLDGSSGSVLQDTESGYSTVLLASSIPQFLTVLGLYCEYRMSWLPTLAEALDARWSLREWAEDIDPATETGDHWDEVFEGDLDDLGSY